MANKQGCNWIPERSIIFKGYNEKIEDKYIDEKGAFDISKCDLIAYANGGYFPLGKKVGKFGFSVKKKKK